MDKFWLNILFFMKNSKLICNYYFNFQNEWERTDKRKENNKILILI